MGDSDHRQTLERYRRALGDGDLDAVGEIFAEDVVVEWPQSGERFRGKESCRNVFANYPGGSPKVLSIRRILGEGNLWITEAEMEYPDAKRYQTVGITEFRDGKIVHEVDYFAEPFPAPEWRMQWVDRD